MNMRTLKNAVAITLISTAFTMPVTNALRADTGATEIDLTYVWTAKEGMNEQLVGTYMAVGEVLEKGEPGLLKYEISVSEKGDQIIIREIFKDNEALAFHLNGTAAQYFPQISKIATPGPFIFRGEVADELKQAAYHMNMGAIFSTEWTGFERD